MAKIGGTVELVAIDSVRQDPANARAHSDESIAAIMASLNRFRQQKPVVVDSKGIIRAGNGTWLAAKKLGWKKILIIRSKLKGEDLTAYAIADNRTAEMAQWDFKTLEAQLAGMGDAAKRAAGFDDIALAELQAHMEKKPRKGKKAAKSERAVTIEESFQVVVECKDEADQQAVFEQMQASGRKCKVLTM